MRSIRNEIKHILRAVMVLAALFTMTFVLAGSANAVVIGPLGDPTVLHAPIATAPIGTAVNPFGVPPAILNSRVASEAFVRPLVFNPFFRPVVFNPFFRPQPFFNPFFGADVDDFNGFGVRVGFGEAD